MKYLKKYENPDWVNNTYRDVYTDYSDPDAVTFGYYDGKLLLSKGSTHYNILKNIIDLGDEEGRKKMDFPGRLWTTSKVISFWKYPSKEELPEILDDIEKANNSINGNDNIDFSDPDWLIEVIDEELEDPNDIEWDDIETILEPISNYIGSKDMPEELMGKAHLDWKLKDELKKKGYFKGWGSDLTAWDSKNTLAWRQAKYQESKKFESCDGIFVEGGKEVDYQSKNVKPFLIDLENDNIYVGRFRDTHADIYDKYGLTNYRYGDRFTDGRLYFDEKIISFWNLEMISDFESTANLINKECNINLFDGEWRLDLCVSRDFDFDKSDYYKNLSNKYYVYQSYEGEDYWFALIPINDYITGEWKKFDISELKTIHLLSWQEKQELKKKGWGRGWGSDLTAWDGKNPLWWRQLKYQENKSYNNEC